VRSAARSGTRSKSNAPGCGGGISRGGALSRECGCRRLGAATFERSVLRPLLATRRIARLTATPPSASTRATTGTLATLSLGPLGLLCLLTLDRSRRHVSPGRLRRALLLNPLLFRTLLVALRLGLLLVARLPFRTTLTLPALGLLLIGPSAALSTLVAALIRPLIVARLRAALTVLALRSTLAVALRALLVPAPLVAAPIAPALTPVAGPATVAITIAVPTKVPIRIIWSGRRRGLRLGRTLVAEEPVPQTRQRAIARTVLRDDSRSDGRCHGRYGYWLGCRRGSRRARNDCCHRRHWWRRSRLLLGGDRVQVHLRLHGHLVADDRKLGHVSLVVAHAAQFVGRCFEVPVRHEDHVDPAARLDAVQPLALLVHQVGRDVHRQLRDHL
jgi:hypothetical protein